MQNRCFPAILRENKYILAKQVFIPTCNNDLELISAAELGIFAPDGASVFEGRPLVGRLWLFVDKGEIVSTRALFR